MGNKHNQCKKCPLFIQHDVYPDVHDAENALIMPGICKDCLLYAGYSKEEINKIVKDLKYIVTHGNYKYALPCSAFKCREGVEEPGKNGYRCADCEDFAGFGVYPHRYNENSTAHDIGVCLKSLAIRGYSDAEIYDLVYELNIAFCDGNHIYPGECSAEREYCADSVE